MLTIIFSYGAVVRGANAYVPPGARKTTGAIAAPAVPAAAKPDVPKVSVNGPDGSTVKETQKPASPAPASAAKVDSLSNICQVSLTLFMVVYGRSLACVP